MRTRSHVRAAVLSVAVAAFSVAVTARAGDKSAKDAAARAQALALFQKALAVSDIRSPGSPPFEMQGTIDLQGPSGKRERGTYVLKWAAPDKWR